MWLYIGGGVYGESCRVVLRGGSVAVHGYGCDADGFDAGVVGLFQGVAVGDHAHLLR